MSKQNFRNRTLFHGDNLDFLRGLNSNSIDLIATDPPFNKGRDFHATPDSLAAGASFQDRWSWQHDVHDAWIDEIKDDHPKVWWSIEASRSVYGDDLGAFLCFMAVRLMAMHRVLKPTGSIFLHCDQTAAHYLKALMDAIFGRKSFINEVIWYYKNASRGKKKLANAHEFLLWYKKGKKYVFNREDVLAPYESGMTAWRYKKKGKTPPKGKTPDDVVIMPTLDTGEEIEMLEGTPDDVIIMPSLNTMAKEREGYPTQKPLELYSWLIKAASNPGDFVLDPFCGCATTVVAAERLDRQWIGMDLWDKAHEVVLNRLEREGLAVAEVSPDVSKQEASGQILLSFGDIYYETSPLTRTDGGEVAVARLRATTKRQAKREPKMTRQEMFEYLIKNEGSICKGCDREFDDPLYLELDHQVPRVDGGSNDLHNRILLCGPCNRIKSHTLTLSGLRRENAKRGRMASPT